jgi:hypothetical protein
MRSRTGIAACAAAAVWLLGLVRCASAGSVVFDSLGGANAGEADTSIGPVMSATFKTGASPLHVDVALSLSRAVPQLGEGGSFTVSLDGGVPLSDLSFDPISGLNYLNGPSVDLEAPVLESVTLPVTDLSAGWTVERFDQFAGVTLNPNSLYWIEVRVTGDPVVEWGLTHDLSGVGVKGNYLAWYGTDDGFFRNNGVQPFAFDQALEMEVTAAPEPSTWAMMLVGFAGLGFAGYRSTRRDAEFARSNGRN